MAVRNVLTRGYGAGATIPFVVMRGYILPIPVPDTHTLRFESVSRSLAFLATIASQTLEFFLKQDGDKLLLQDGSLLAIQANEPIIEKIAFSSDSRSIAISNADDPLGFLLTEAGAIISQDNGLPIALE